MKYCIFSGPTLPEAERGRLPDALWLPPAKQGDVYRALTLLQPRCIAIVDS